MTQRSPAPDRALSRWPLLPVVLVAAAAGLALAIVLGLGRPATPVTTASFTGLEDTSGQSASTTLRAGHYRLLAYGYTGCPDACPATLLKLHGILEALEATTPGVEPVFVTLDPLHDTAAVLQAYTRHFDARIVGLSGTVDAVQASARALGALPDDPALATAPTGGPNHAVRLFLLAPDNTLLRSYELADPTRLVAADIRQRVQRR